MEDHFDPSHLHLTLDCSNSPTIYEETHNHDHVDTSMFYESRQTLHRIRIVLFFISTFHWGSRIFEWGWAWFSTNIQYFTFWNSTAVQFYLAWVVFFYPKHKTLSNNTVIAQQAILICQTIVVLIYWFILAPSFGWNLALQYDLGFYPHSIPFLFMVHELFATYGTYGSKGEIAGVVVCVVYAAFNIYLRFFHGILVYSTAFLDPKNLKCYIALPLNLLLGYGIGKLCTKMKNSLVRKARERLYGENQKKIEEAERMAEKSEIGL